MATIAVGLTRLIIITAFISLRMIVLASATLGITGCNIHVSREMKVIPEMLRSQKQQAADQYAGQSLHFSTMITKSNESMFKI
jgi:hypothetical protein